MAAVYRRIIRPSGKPDRIKDDFTKTVAPTATDDLDGGWKAGSLWLDTVTGILYVAESVADGAAVWNPAGTSSLGGLPDVIITAATDGESLVFDGTSWVDRPSARHSHVIGEAAVGDGATTVFYLANEAEADSVAGYDNGVRVSLTQDAIEPDKVTFAAAPSGAILYDYIPVTA